jgi:urea carboxylase
LLRFFDQIRFYEVSHDELMQIRRDFPLGRFEPRIENATFRLADYQKFLEQNHDSITAFKATQSQAFSEERARWQAAGKDLTEIVETTVAVDEEALKDNEWAVMASVPGSVWQMKVKPGDRVRSGDVVAVIESMKMEFPVEADASGVVTRLSVKEGQQVNPGQVMLVLEEMSATEDDA